MARAPLYPNDLGARVLVVLHDGALRGMVAEALERSGLLARGAAGGDAALRAFDEFRPDLVILDLATDSVSGLDVAERLRGRLAARPVIFVTGSTATTEDKVSALEIADDVVSAPLAAPELVARVRAVLRRTRGDGGGVLRFDDVVLDERTYEVSRDGQPIELTRLEFELLRFLMRNARRVVSRSEILANVWRKPFGEPALVETYVGYLRRKLDALGPPLLYTVRGVGYVLRSSTGR